MNEQNILNFEELDLEIAQVLEIQTGNADQRFECTLVGCIAGQAVIVTVPDSGEFPILKEGQSIAIRVLMPNGVAVFPSTVLFISDMPLFMVYIDFPDAIRFKRLRDATRVDVNLPVLVSNLNHHDVKGVVAEVMDMSTTGARIRLKQEIGKLGDTLELKGKFSLANIKRMVTVPAVIRSKAKDPDGSITFGLQYSNLDDDELIFLFGVVFSQLAFGHAQRVG